MKTYRTYHRRNGKKKPTRLYQVWDNMRSRVNGGGTKRPDLYEGLEIGWSTFAEFRAYALANGFSKETPSPDRQNTLRGYVPGNVVFVPIHENRMRALCATPGHDDVRGPEPPDYYDEVPF